jgi:hypothetical protein
MATASDYERRTYWTIYSGRFATRTQANAPGAFKRINKLNKEVWEKYYDQLEGVISHFEAQDSKFGRQLMIELDGADIIKVPWSSRYTTGFLSCYPNFDPEVPVTFRPYAFTPEDQPDKIRRGWTMMQQKARIPAAYTKEELPRLKELTVKGVKVWDDTDLLDFLWDGAIKAWAVNQQGAVPPEQQRGAINEDDDEPPF